MEDLKKRETEWKLLKEKEGINGGVILKHKYQDVLVEIEVWLSQPRAGWLHSVSARFLFKNEHFDFCVHNQTREKALMNYYKVVKNVAKYGPEWIISQKKNSAYCLFRRRFKNTRERNGIGT